MAEDWVGAAASQLERLADNRYYGKMRATIIAIVGARLAGQSEETVWKPRRPETCSRSVYHGDWKKQPLFADVLKEVERLAREFADSKALRAKQQAGERLALATPAAVAVAMREMQNDDPAIRLRAAFGILDRAGLETAVNQVLNVNGQVKQQHTHGFDGKTATTIFDFLAAIGAFPAGADDAANNEIHSADADS